MIPSRSRPQTLCVWQEASDLLEAFLLPLLSSNTCDAVLKASPEHIRQPVLHPGPFAGLLSAEQSAMFHIACAWVAIW